MMLWLTLLSCLAYSSSFGTLLNSKVIANQNLVSRKQKLPLTKAATVSDRLSTRREALLESGLAFDDSLTQSFLLAQSPSPLIKQGQEISINGQKFSVAWSQWREGTSVRTGISDTGAMKTLGLELLSTSNPSVQPVAWFSSGSLQPLLLKARFISPYRYLDITDLVQADWQLQVIGNTLSINSAPAQILNIRVGKQSWGQRIVLDLDRPTFWQATQTQGEGILTLAGTASQTLLHQFQPPPEDQKNSFQGLINIESSNIESSKKIAKLRFAFSEGKKMHIFSLSEPNRLVIDIKPEPLAEREIAWAAGIRWLQQSVTINSWEETKGASSKKQFPVIWLEIDPRSNVSLKPITSRPDTQVGIAPLANTARLSQAVAAINGGFFNRNNQLPLGAIRQDGRWLSGPILNRGAIAWGNGTVKIGRLSLQEVLTTSNHRLPVLSLNSGYVEAGLSRYTSEWGPTYSPLTDNETIILVENNRVTQLKTDVSQGSFPIPADGYLLTLRGSDLPGSALTVRTQVSLDAILPADFTDFPQIIGAGPLLLQNRQVVLDAAREKFSLAFNRQAASRSAIGITEQGTLVLAAIHSGSTGKGPTLGELAQIMQRLGAIDALNLDGGSSTSLYLGGQIIDRPLNSAARVHNGLGIFIW